MYRTGSGSALLCLAQSLTASHAANWSRHNGNNINNNNHNNSNNTLNDKNNNNNNNKSEDTVAAMSQKIGKKRVLLKARYEEVSWTDQVAINLFQFHMFQLRQETNFLVISYGKVAIHCVVKRLEMKHLSTKTFNLSTLKCS